jgi:hypothetical protein
MASYKTLAEGSVDTSGWETVQLADSLASTNPGTRVTLTQDSQGWITASIAANPSGGDLSSPEGDARVEQFAYVDVGGQPFIPDTHDAPIPRLRILVDRTASDDGGKAVVQAGLWGATDQGSSLAYSGFGVDFNALSHPGVMAVKQGGSQAISAPGDIVAAIGILPVTGGRLTTPRAVGVDATGARVMDDANSLSNVGWAAETARLWLAVGSGANNASTTTVKFKLQYERFSRKLIANLVT